MPAIEEAIFAGIPVNVTLLFSCAQYVAAAEAFAPVDMVDRAVEFALQEGFAAVGERVVITGGVPLGRTGATNMLRVAFVEG